MIFLIVLAGCQQSPTGSTVIIDQVDDGPKHVVVKSSPAPSEPEPVPEPEPQWIPENVLPPPEEPEVIVIPENKPPEDPVLACVEKCESSCETSASAACSQTSGSGCKAFCGNVIDTSACSTACSLRNARRCEPKFIEFCSAQCNSRCY